MSKAVQDAKEALPWKDFADLKKQADAVRKDISTARGILNDALTRYVKKKVNARNKKQAEDMAIRFADLEPYSSERDIQDAYGYDMLSEKEYDRLIDLWRMREKYVDDSGQFSDNVTEMLHRAMNSLGDEYQELFALVADMERAHGEREQEIARANARADYERYKASL